MTICLYHNRTLYADRAGVVLSRPSHHAEMKKIYITPNSKAAIALSGKEFVINESLIKTLITLEEELVKSDAFASPIVMSQDILDLFEGREFLIITRQRAYLGADTVIRLLDLDMPCCIGSGTNYAMIALVAGKSPLEAIRISSITDGLSYLTDIDSIQMRDLK